MTVSLRPIFQPSIAKARLSQVLHPYSPRSLQRSIYTIQKHHIPFLHRQHSHFSTFRDKIFKALHQLKNFSHSDQVKTTRKFLELITGMKQLNAEETKQAIIDHQKLWVAHASIDNHLQAHTHYEMIYSMQLFCEPKDFSTQEYYLNLFKKKTEDLSIKELREIVDLYQFSLAQSDPFVFHSLNHQLQKYQSLLLEIENKH